MIPEKSVIRIERNGPNNDGLQPMELDPADFQSSLPTQNIYVYYEDASVGLTVGVWDTTTMQEKFGPYPGDEFIWVLEGHFAMLDSDGKAVRAQQNDAVSFRNGTPVSWKQDGYLKKFIITYLDPNAETPKIDSADAGVIVINPNSELATLKDTDPFEISGPNPLQRNHTAFTNDTGNMSVGVWDSRAMVSEMRPFPTYEFVQMLDGEISTTEENGETKTFVAGDCFLVPKGAVCSWKIEYYARKYYAVLDVA